MSTFVPGKSLLPDGTGRWGDVQVQGYEYGPTETRIPPLRDFLIITYDLPGRLFCRTKGVEHDVYVEPGECSLLSFDETSSWRWQGSLRNTLVFLSRWRVAKVASEILDRDISRIDITDTMKLRDPQLTHAARMLMSEANMGGPGGELYADSVSTQISVALVRRYYRHDALRASTRSSLTAARAHRLEEYINDNLATRLTLDELANVACMSTFHFLRQFKAHFGHPPHTYVIRTRLKRAYELVTLSDLPLKQIAASCGFCDQSHMNRWFSAHYGAPPGVIRANETA